MLHLWFWPNEINESEKSDPAPATSEFAPGRDAVKIAHVLELREDVEFFPGKGARPFHQAANFEPSTVPGHPLWHMAPKSMAWQQRSLAQICAQLFLLLALLSGCGVNISQAKCRTSEDGKAVNTEQDVQTIVRGHRPGGLS